MAEKTSVLVIGGGIGGFANALALARLGADVRLVEQAPEFGEVGAGLQMSPNATGILERWGLLDQAIETGVAPQQIIFRDAITGKDLLAQDVMGEFRERYGAPYIVAHRSDLHRVFWQTAEAEGVRTTNNVHIEKVENLPGGAGAVATAADGTEYRADVIIAADGLKSGVRRQLSDDEPVGSAYVAYRGALPIKDVKHASDMNAVVVYFGPQCHLVQYPLRRGDLFNTAAVYRSKSFEEGRLHIEGDEELREAYKDCVPEVQDALGNVNHVQRWPMFDREPITDWVDGRIALIGDAAHPMLQYLAQGACQAIEDAGAIQEAARTTVFADPENPDPSQWDAALAAYNEERAPRAGRIQSTARMWGEAWHLDGDVERTVRNMLFESAGRNGIWEYTDWLYGHRVGTGAAAQEKVEQSTVQAVAG